MTFFTACETVGMVWQRDALRNNIDVGADDKTDRDRRRSPVSGNVIRVTPSSVLLRNSFEPQ